MDTKLLLRIGLSPFVFGGYLAMCLAGLIFPTSMLMMMSAIQFLTLLVVDILNLALEEPIKTDFTNPFFDNTSSPYIGYLMGVFIIVWLPFFGAFQFVKLGRLSLS